jgi:hypothetical protein
MRTCAERIEAREAREAAPYDLVLKLRDCTLVVAPLPLSLRSLAPGGAATAKVPPTPSGPRRPPPLLPPLSTIRC